MHLHAYSVPDVRIVPPRAERGGWEPDEVFTETDPAVSWLTDAMRELCAGRDKNGKDKAKDKLPDFTDEVQVWSTVLSAGESVHTGAKGTTLIVEAWPDCDCFPQNAEIAPLRRGRRR